MHPKLAATGVGGVDHRSLFKATTDSAGDTKPQSVVFLKDKAQLDASHSAFKHTAAEVDHAKLPIKPASVADFPVTDAVAIPTGGGKRPIDLAQYYEKSVCKQYGVSEKKEFKVEIDGKEIKGVADHVIMDEGKRVAIDAKYVDNWSESIRNPAYTSNKPWLVTGGEREMIEQARKYSSHFDEFRYHTNSPELAEHYTKVFNAEGIKNFKFIITPAVKK
jgi:hypothetical protein